VILDLFSRYIVGWTVAYRETAQLATALIEQATEQQQITPRILTLHADRGGPMKYRPEFPARFDSIEHAREHCRAFVD
jgi:putative transposase